MSATASTRLLWSGVYSGCSVQYAGYTCQEEAQGPIYVIMEFKIYKINSELVNINNIPNVARAAQQTPFLLIHWFNLISHPLCAD